VADQLLWSTGVGLILLGFVLAFIAMILLVVSGTKGGRAKVRGGGAVIIGPIPIVFGTDKESVKVILILSIALVALLLVFMMFSNGLFR
jgi:uncharacterized protein (TIGR00304 family)